MTYLESFLKSQVLGKFIQSALLVRNFSIPANLEVEKPSSKGKRKTHYISPPLTSERTKEIKSVTGIVTGVNYISWVNMSVPGLHLLDWKLKLLPSDFSSQKDESSILSLAYDVRNNLPISDLYVMESLTIRDSKQYIGINKLQLSSMLAVLLNDCNKDKNWKEKVIFQKKAVMNYLYNIQIASERVSTRSIVENILKSSYLHSNCDAMDNSLSNYPSITFEPGFFETFKQSETEKQEYLSLALLLTLSFIDVNLFMNPNSVNKIQKRRKYK